MTDVNTLARIKEIDALLKSNTITYKQRVSLTEEIIKLMSKLEEKFENGTADINAMLNINN